MSIRVEFEADRGASVHAFRVRASGESYSAFRDRVRSLRLPLVEAHRAAFDVMYACNEENVAKVSTLPETSPGISDTDEAQAKIERLQELNQAYMRLIDADPPGT